MRYKAGRKYPIPIKFINDDLNDSFKKGAYIRRRAHARAQNTPLYKSVRVGFFASNNESPTIYMKQAGEMSRGFFLSDDGIVETLLGLHLGGEGGGGGGG